MSSGKNIISVENNNHHGSSDNKYIEHQVSSMDTLAGIAIKYGVEVADIRKLNNLVTDLQIFAVKTLLIPLHGRHSPSPRLSTDSKSLRSGPASPRNSRTIKRIQKSSSCIFDVMQSLSTRSPPDHEVSPAITASQKQYQLEPLNPIVATRETKMAAYRRTVSEKSTNAVHPNAFHLKPRKSGDPFDENSIRRRPKLESNSRTGSFEKIDENNVRRRQKLESNSRTDSFEKLSDEENNGSNTGYSLSGNSVAMRTKSASQSGLSGGPDMALVNTIPVGLGDTLLIDSGQSGVTKPSTLSTPQNEDRPSSFSLWTTSKWCDFQALTTASISMPIFESFPIHITGRKKAATD